MANTTFDLTKFQKLQEELKAMKETPEFLKAQKAIKAEARKAQSAKRSQLHKTALKLYRAMEKDGTLATNLKKYQIA